jgi:hypothetical protein
VAETRLVTWNCSKGAYSKKVPLLEPMVADVAVIQECAKPVVESDRCLWFGDNANQGVLVLATDRKHKRSTPDLLRADESTKLLQHFSFDALRTILLHYYRAQSAP